MIYLRSDQFKDYFKHKSFFSNIQIKDFAAEPGIIFIIVFQCIKVSVFGKRKFHRKISELVVFGGDFGVFGDQMFI